MKKVLCVFPPFCSPVSPPYSITYIADFLKRNTTEFEFILFDHNAWLHKKVFSDEYDDVISALSRLNIKDYGSSIKIIKQKIEEFSKEQNNLLRDGKKSDYFDMSMKEILSKKPDIVLFSLVYNSQAFFSMAIIKELKKKGIIVIVGGPAVTPQIKKEALYLPNEVALLEELTGKKADFKKINTEQTLDYSSYKPKDYFAPEKIICLHTTSCCYYQKCTFCTHHNFGKYIEYDLEDIKKSIIASKAKLVFLIDDMIHKKRLLDIAKVLKPLNIHWMCQLKPTIDLDRETLKALHESGLRVVIWGVESGSNRILSLMEKGTNVTDIKEVLETSEDVGITNVLYIMFGFPTETKEEFIQTIDFLRENSFFIELVSTSIFGLQENSLIEQNPDKYSISNVTKTKRKMLPDKINYDQKKGLSKEDAKLLRKKYKKTLESINKFPKEMNIYREHMLYLVSRMR